MPEPQATPIANSGDAEWFPPAEDDNRALPPQHTSGFRYIFFGADGLRAGWSMLLFLFTTLLISASIIRANKALGLLHFAPHKGAMSEHPLGIFLFSHGPSLLGALIAALLLGRIEHRRMRKYFLGALRGKQFLAGAAWGLVLFSLLILILRSTHLLVFDSRVLFGAAMVKWGLVWLASFLCVALGEEYLVRGYLQFTLARGVAGILGALGMEMRSRTVTGFWAAAVFFSFLFGLGHKGNPGESPLGLVAAGLVGLVFAFSVWRTGSLWWAVGWHMAWDWAESFLFGTADSGTTILNPLFLTHPVGTPIMSGGLTGPEGSVYAVAIVLLTAVVIALTLPVQTGSPADPAYTPNN